MESCATKSMIFCTLKCSNFLSRTPLHSIISNSLGSSITNINYYQQLQTYKKGCRPSTTCCMHMGRYTYDDHENCLVFKNPHPTVHLRPKFSHPLDLRRPVLTELFFLQQTMEQQSHRACGQTKLK